MLRRFRLLWLTGACALGATLVVSASSAQAVVVQRPNGRLLSVGLQQGVSAASIPGSIASKHRGKLATSPDNLNYNGGPVLHSSDPYLIFWTPTGDTTLPASSESLLERYFTDVAADSGKATNVYGVDRQFTDSAGFADYAQSFSSSSQAIVDTQPYPTRSSSCPVGSGYPYCVTDAQMQAEVARLIAADGLPTDGPTSNPELNANAPIYFVVLPPDVNTCFTGSNECATNVFCAYHSPMTDGSNTVLYANIPTYLAKTDPKSCQYDGNSQVQEPNGDQIGDVTSKYMSHEDNETITDPLINAWYSDTSGNEDGDQCNFFGSFDPPGGQNPDAFKPTLGGNAAAGTLYDQLINNDEYYIQTEWSNGDVNCEAQPNASGVTLTDDFTAAAKANDVVSFTPSGSSTDGYSSVTWSFGDGQQSFDNSGAAPAPVSHTYAAPGTYTVKLTVVDTKGNLSTATHQVTVGEPPTAAFTFKPHKPTTGQHVKFNATSSSDPDSGGSIVSYKWKFGDGKTATGAKATHVYKKKGTYTVTLTVTDSSGLTAKITHKVKVV